MPLRQRNHDTRPGPREDRFFCPCPRGLEGALAAELIDLGIASPEVVPGGVAFAGRWTDCYRVNLWSRIASRVLWRVGGARYRDEDDVYRAASALGWPDWFQVGQTIRVNVAAVASPLRSIEFITLRIKDAVCDRFRAHCGSRPSVDTASPDVRIHVFLTDREATFYLDTSGEALFKRGSRREVTEAPLRENLAAGILRLTGWHPGEPLLDPMCGGGTFLAEAAQIALGLAPGAGRRFGFEQLSVFEPEPWKQARADAMSRAANVFRPQIFGSDIDPAAIEAARTNLRAAGVLDFVTLECADATLREAPAPSGVLVANPPYGVRIGDRQNLQALYPKLGDALKQRFAGWRAYIFSADLELPRHIRLKASKRTPLFNGPLECRLFEYRMVSGALRRETRPGPDTESPPGQAD